MDAVRVRRLRDTDEALAVLEPLEPGMTFAAAGVAQYGATRLNKVWVAERTRGEPAGIVGVTRYCRDRWIANVYCTDDAAGRALAKVVDASPARRVIGVRRHAERLVPHLSRGKRVFVVRGGSVEPGLNVTGFMEFPPSSARVARPTDLDALVELYSTYELEIAPTARRLREVLEPLVHARRVFVVEESGRILAAQRVEQRSRKYQVMSGLVVVPEARGRRLSRDLTVAQGGTSDLLGLGVLVIIALSNRSEWSIKVEDGVDDTWLDVILATPRPPFKGYALGARVLEQLEGRVHRRSAESSRRA